MRTLRLPVVDLTDAPADLNELVRFAERRNLVSARVPSHFKRSLHNALQYHEQWVGAEAHERIVTERTTTKKRCWCLPISVINILKVVEHLSRFYVTYVLRVHYLLFLQVTSQDNGTTDLYIAHFSTQADYKNIFTYYSRSLLTLCSVVWLVHRTISLLISLLWAVLRSISFAKHHPEDCHRRWPKHVGGLQCL
jgi:hypothetical protein